MEFHTATHTVTGKPMVEVWQNEKLTASIYAHEDGMQIVSKYLAEVWQDEEFIASIYAHEEDDEYPAGEHEVAMPANIVIKFSK